jgi:hypothetical protein
METGVPLPSAVVVLRRSGSRSVRPGRRFTFVLLTALLAATACGGDDSAESPSPAPTRSVSESQPGGGAGVVPDALRFRAPLVGGGEVDLSTFAGRPVVLWFWAPY